MKPGVMMSFVLDFGIIAIIALFVYSGVKRGIVYMLINTAGSLLAAAAAPFIASMLSLTVYNSFVKGAIISTAENATQGIDAPNLTAQAEQIINALSNFGQNVFQIKGISVEFLETELKRGQDVPSLIEGLLRPLALRMVSACLSFVLFLILVIIIGLVAKKLTRAISRTKLTVPNKIFGGVVGAVGGLLVVMVLSLILYFVMMFLPPDNCQELRNSIDHTWIYQYIDRLSIPNLIISQFSMK